jgi:hypothetical protein
MGKDCWISSKSRLKNHIIVSIARPSILILLLCIVFPPFVIWSRSRLKESPHHIVFKDRIRCSTTFIHLYHLESTPYSPVLRVGHDCRHSRVVDLLSGIQLVKARLQS